MLLDYSYGERVKSFRSGGKKLYSVPREPVPCRVFVVTHGCRASFLYVYHAKNGVKSGTGFGRADLLLPWPRKQGLNPSQSCPP